MGAALVFPIFTASSLKAGPTFHHVGIAKALMENLLFGVCLFLTQRIGKKGLGNHKHLKSEEGNLEKTESKEGTPNPVYILGSHFWPFPKLHMYGTDPKQLGQR